MKAALLALTLVLGGSALALAAPVAEADGPDVCLTYWYCVVHCTLPPHYYCKCAPECPPPPQDDW